MVNCHFVRILKTVIHSCIKRMSFFNCRCHLPEYMVYFHCVQYTIVCGLIYVILLIGFLGKILLHWFNEHHITSILVPLYMVVNAYWVFIFVRVIKRPNNSIQKEIKRAWMLLSRFLLDCFVRWVSMQYLCLIQW